MQFYLGRNEKDNWIHWAFKKLYHWLGVVAQAYNLSTLEAEVGGSQGQEIETILVNMVKPRLY